MYVQTPDDRKAWAKAVRERLVSDVSDYRITPTWWRIVLAIFIYAEAGGPIYPSYKTVAEDVQAKGHRCCRETVGRCVRALAEMGYLVIEPHKHTSNTLVLTLPMDVAPRTVRGRARPPAEPVVQPGVALTESTSTYIPAFLVTRLRGMGREISATRHDEFARHNAARQLALLALPAAAVAQQQRLPTRGAAG